MKSKTKSKSSSRSFTEAVIFLKYLLYYLFCIFVLILWLSI